MISRLNTISHIFCFWSVNKAFSLNHFFFCVYHISRTIPKCPRKNFPRSKKPSNCNQFEKIQMYHGLLGRIGCYRGRVDENLGHRHDVKTHIRAFLNNEKD